MCNWETATILTIGILFGSLYFYRKTRRIVTDCIVSKAHLTCDPGDDDLGYNNVVATVRFSSTIDSAAFFECFRSCLIDHASLSVWCKQMKFCHGSMKWESVEPSTWNPLDHLLVRSESIPETDIEKIVANYISEPIHLSRPCWDMIFLERVTSDDGTFSVCMFKYHHALADGFTMLRHMLLRTCPAEGSIQQTGLELLPGFNRIPSSRSRHSIPTISRSVLSVLTQSSDRPSTFRAATPRKPGEKVLVAFSDLPGVTVDRLKRLSQLFGKHFRKHFSLNDVLVSALTIAMRDFDTSERGTVEVRDATSVIWVSLPRDTVEEKLESGNGGLGFASCALPLSIDTHNNVLATVCETQKRLSALKASAEPAVINMALYLIGSLPVWLGKRISALAADKASASISNMAGPSGKLVWPVPTPESRGNSTPSGSGVVESVYFATSPPFHYGPLFSLLTYHGKVYISVSARAELFTQDELSKLVKFYLLNAVIKMETSI